MQEKLYKLIGDILNIRSEDISDDLTMREIETWDSLKHMELIVSIEREYDVQLTFEEIVQMQSVQAIKNILSIKA
ncbi:MAG: acyl carrier protein [Chloroflexi bacterium]|nr:acyl carrier protein [Chloroflexota bacterium]